jgi:glycerol uptake facilitator-like aquaporin
MPALRRAASEFVGTAFLLAAIVGSGIMGVNLSAGNAAITLLANSLATGAALVALILTFAPISGAHFNPLVTLTSALQRSLEWKAVPAYLLAQTTGAIAGVTLANGIFGLPVIYISTRVRSGNAQHVSEFVATFGLVTVISLCGRHRPASVPYAVAAYVTAAYWFFSSTSFANPAVTVARSLTDTFSGIRPDDVPGFIAAQFGGAIAAAMFCRAIDAEKAGRP